MESVRTWLCSVVVTGLLMTSHPCQGRQPSPEVSSPAGRFRGTVLTSPQGHEFQAYLGIPFALPPVGELRFAKPQPHPVIEGVYDATKLPPKCLQNNEPGLEDKGQEDCLYLNVFLPAGATSSQRKKVFVYIYGGGLVMGSVREHLPGDLVALGDVIVVTLNYRLNLLGFLYADHPDLPGNQAFWDQLQALTWVKQNIRSFGGDPDDVTIGGESAGAISVTFLSIIPQGKGLFNRAIPMSGSAAVFAASVESGKLQLSKLTERVGCQHEDIDTTVKCLKQLPTEAFYLPFDLSQLFTLPVVDGESLLAPVQELLEDQDYLEKVGFYARDYLASAVNNEGVIVFTDTFDCGLDKDNPDVETLGVILEVPPSVAQKVLEWYDQHESSVQKPAVDIMADYLLLMPLATTVDIFTARDEAKRGSIYVQYFDFTPDYVPGTFDEGFPHALDVSYLLDRPINDVFGAYYATQAKGNLTDQDWQLKNRYINIVADFTKHRNPGISLKKQLNINWPLYQLDTRPYLALQPEPKVQLHYLEERINFWRFTVPQMVAEYEARKQEL